MGNRDALPSALGSSFWSREAPSCGPEYKSASGLSHEFVPVSWQELEQAVPDRFEKIVRLHPHRLAVKARDHWLTYEALNQAANRIAHAILAKRAQGNEPIALLFEHSIDVITAIFGTLKSGKFYVALDPSFPQERNTYILEDSGAGLIVTNGRNLNLAHRLVNNTRPLLSIDEIDESFSSDNIGLSVSPDDLVTIYYTSGSTGEPKGVVEMHRNVLYSRIQLSDEMRICADDRLSLLHSVSFASASVHLFASLLTGASLFPFNIKSDGIHRLAKWMREEQITAYHSSPVVFRQLADLVSGHEKLPKLRLIHLSGAPITQLDFDLYKKNFSPGTLLQVGMGSTEARGICSAVVNQTFSFPKDGAPVGYPRPGKRVLLLNENGHEVGPNQVGEIAIKQKLPVYMIRQPLCS